MRFIRFLLGLLGAIAIAIAALAVAADVVAFARDGKLFAKPLGQIWREMHLLSLQLFQVGVERKLGAIWLWQSVIQPMLGWKPIAVAGVFAAAGTVLLWIGRLGRRHT